MADEARLLRLLERDLLPLAVLDSPNELIEFIVALRLRVRRCLVDVGTGDSLVEWERDERLVEDLRSRSLGGVFSLPPSVASMLEALPVLIEVLCFEERRRLAVLRKDSSPFICDPLRRDEDLRLRVDSSIFSNGSSSFEPLDPIVP